MLIFQQGHLQSLLGFKSIGGVTSWLPLFLFVILFGLSMDYHVLILSRVRESYDTGMTTEQAVSHGIRATAGVVTSAAIVMVAVFAIFATLGMIDFKMMGVGLAVAVLLDATIVRAVLLPAAMKLLGDWNWYLPRWLQWLPRVGPRSHRDRTPSPCPSRSRYPSRTYRLVSDARRQRAPGSAPQRRLNASPIETEEPVAMGPVTTAVVDDTCGNLIQIAPEFGPLCAAQLRSFALAHEGQAAPPIRGVTVLASGEPMWRRLPSVHEFTDSCDFDTRPSIRTAS